MTSAGKEGALRSPEGQMRPTLITGGAGYLGRHLAHAVAERGEPVLVLDDLSESNSSFWCPELTHPGVRCIRGTTLDAALMSELVAQSGTIVHFASVVGVERTISQPVQTTQNIVGTINLIAGLRRHHVVIFGSSADVYGMHSLLRRGPMREDEPVLFENSLVNRWIYAKVKSLEENLVCNTPARAVVIRFFNTYGPFMDWPSPKRVIPQFVRSVLDGNPLRISGDGTQSRCFCYYTDTVRGILLAIDVARDMRARHSMVVNIGNDEEVSILQLADIVNQLAQELGVATVPVMIGAGDLYSQGFDDAWNRRPDLSVAASMLGFAPCVSLRAGLRRTLQTMLPNAVSPRAVSAHAASGNKHPNSTSEHDHVQSW